MKLKYVCFQPGSSKNKRPEIAPKMPCTFHSLRRQGAMQANALARLFRTGKQCRCRYLIAKTHTERLRATHSGPEAPPAARQTQPPEPSHPLTFARYDLPVPGGPYSRMPLQGLRLPVKNCGNLTGRMTASLRASLAPSSPATSSHWRGKGVGWW